MSAPTRRALLGGAVALPALAAAAASASAAGDRTAWQAALAAHAQARRTFEATCEGVEVASKRYFALRPEPQTYETFGADDTVESFNARQAERRVLDARHRDDSGMAAAEEAQGLASDADYAALAAVIAAPAPDLGAVLHKLALAKAEGLEMGELDGVLADLRRFQREGRA